MEPVYETSTDDGVFTLKFQAPRQLLLHDDFDAMVWDECLRQAHAAGVMPVGPILVTHSEIEDAPPKPSELREGESMKERMERWQAENGHRYVMEGFASAAQVDLIQVTASVQIGVAL